MEGTLEIFFNSIFLPLFNYWMYFFGPDGRNSLISKRKPATKPSVSDYSVCVCVCVILAATNNCVFIV